MLIFNHRRLALVLLGLLFSYGKIVDGKCRPYQYQHYNHNDICLMCRICADDEERVQVREPRCGNHLLSDGRKVQCSNTNLEIPSCPKWKVSTGNFCCTNKNLLYSMCEIRCPPGYKPSFNGGVECLPHLFDRIKWNRPVPYCIAEELEQNNGQKILSGFAIVLMFGVCSLAPCLLLIIMISCRRKKIIGRVTDQGPGDEPHLVDVKVLNAKRYQRSYILNKWVAKKETNITVKAIPSTSSVRDFLICHEGSMTQYTATPAAIDEIVLHHVTANHRGRYNWTVTLYNNQSASGDFLLDVKSKSLIETVVRFSRQFSNTSNEVEYEELSQEQDAPVREPGFSGLLKNMADTRRLCTLFDQEDRVDTVTWHDLGVTFLRLDRHDVGSKDYHLRQLKDNNGPTYSVLKTMHQEGKTLQDLVDYLKLKVGPTCEAVQILNKYL